MFFLPNKYRTFKLAIASFTLAAAASTVCSAISKPLEGGIEHTDRLPGVEQGLLPGHVFEGVTPSEKAVGQWIRLPNWLCGTWQTDRETAMFRKDFRTGDVSSETPYSFKAKVRFSYGMQKDASGAIWHYVATPYTSATDLSSFTEYHIVKSKKFITVNEEKVAFVTRATVVRVRRESRTVKETFQQESVTSYSPVVDGKIKLVGSTKSFDAAGAPAVQADNEANIPRLQEFTPVDTLNGQDLRELFAAYLTKIGCAHLVPKPQE